MPAGWEIAVDLLRASRAVIEELHERLAEEGHAALRPAHGYVLQAVGAEGTTATRVGEVLGVSKQAAGQIVEELESLGYLERAPDPADARRKLVLLTDRGTEALDLSARIFDGLRDEWAEEVGPAALEALDDTLRAGARLFGSSGEGLRPIW